MKIYVNNKGHYVIEFLHDDLFLEFAHWVIKNYKDIDNAHRSTIFQDR